MKLQKGKFYRTRSGEKVECLTTERNDERPVIMLWENGDFTLHFITGEYCISKEESEDDIISEWSDVEIPWDDYPSWCAKIEFLSQYKRWVMLSGIGECIAFIPSEYAPKGFEGDWKDSKFERPKKD